MATEPTEVADSLVVETPQGQDVETQSSQPAAAQASAPNQATVPTVPPATEPKPVNLDDLPEFRNYKSARDKKEAEYQKKLGDLEKQAAELRQAQEEAALRNLKVQLDATEDDGQRQQLISQMAAVQARNLYEAERQWAQHVARRAKEEGLDDQDFDPLKYRGPEGAVAFERDLLAVSRDRLKKEAAEAKAAASPETIAALVKAELAKALRAQGVDAAVEASGPTSTPDRETAWRRDTEAWQQGKLSNAEYLTRWRDK